ncbi:unnamed protein product, partial [Timema podura]|nr:unnamed protein product [Timema podura]
ILKHTDKKNPDHSALERALSAIREVMTYINEDKRKTENQFVMFGIFNDIDCCPPNLVSAQRNFVSRVDVMELSEGLSGRGDTLVLFLFSDTLEVCKRRNNKGHNSMKSPNTSSLTRQASGKPYKHIRLMPLTNIKKVIDIKETNDCHNVFALMCRSPEEFKERLFSFTIMDDETDKGVFLKTLCRQMANAICRPDALDIDTSDVVVGTLSKAFKFARTRLKVGRAFSFNKTPSKLKRAVSTMISPFGSTNNLTPSYQLAQMRLASCNNLNLRVIAMEKMKAFSGRSETTQKRHDQNTSKKHRSVKLWSEEELTGSSNKEETYVAPMSVQPTRKNKNGSVTMASLRRL